MVCADLGVREKKVMLNNDNDNSVNFEGTIITLFQISS